jgi:hypothetical protein
VKRYVAIQTINGAMPCEEVKIAEKTEIFSN